ncbi:hypothetical protein F4809DRAFT_665173 [Biscogniauxia mediterranea]|nr:hypothetical protein F4809DRAFT_665173 [Biscogniauxia mediterranea]
MPLQPQKSHSSAEMDANHRSRHSNPETSAVVKPPLKDQKRFLSALFPKKPPAGKSPRSDANYDVFPGKLPSLKDDKTHADIQQLRKSIRKIKNTSNVDSAYEEYEKIRDTSREICKALLNMSLQRREPLLVSPTTTATSAGLETQPGSLVDDLSSANTRSSISTNSLADASQQLATQNDQYLAVVREWERCLQELSEALRKSLQDTYDEHDQNPTSDGFEKICKDKAARRVTIQNMRNVSVSKTLSEDPGFFPKYDIRFRNYDQMKKDLVLMRSQMTPDEPEISPEREVVTRTILASGDVMLEFANRDAPNHPVLRFRVSSSVLADKSSFFRRIFNSDAKAILDDHVCHGQQLPPAPSNGGDVKLYSIPGIELNRKGSLEILLHAAHGCSGRMPGNIEFEKFVAIAEVCLRYQCTLPLEYFVKHMWLPQWARRVTADMFDGLLLISYTFGLPADFTYMSRAAILNLVDEADLESKCWPQNIKDKIRAKRRAYIAQVYECCRSLLLEYISPSTDSYIDPDQIHNGILEPIGKTRCSKGCPECDASNLGWIMMTFRDLGILPHVIPSAIFTDLLPPPSPSPPRPPTRSLAQLLGALRLTTSHVRSHDGVACDFAPAFRRAVADIEACVAGLTLADVSPPNNSSNSNNNNNSKSGCWALSEGTPDLDRAFFFFSAPHTTPSGSRRRRRRTPPPPTTTTTTTDLDTRLREDTRLRVLAAADSARDLRALALANRAFYATYRRNRAVLERERREGRTRTRTTPDAAGAGSSSSSNSYRDHHATAEAAQEQEQEQEQEGAKMRPRRVESKYRREDYDLVVGSRDAGRGG